MARVNGTGYVERKVMKRVFRDWWLIKNAYGQSGGKIELKDVVFPPEYVGKRIRIKVEVL